MILLAVMLGCTSAPPQNALTGELTGGHRRVGEGSDVSVWLTDETVTFSTVEELACEGTGCRMALSVEATLQGTYRDYSTHPVEGVCCDSTLEERTWDAVVTGTMTLYADPDRFVFTIDDASGYEISVLHETATTTGDNTSVTTLEDFEAYPGLIGQSGSVFSVTEGCESPEEYCWTAVDWQDSTGIELSAWDEGRIAGVLRAEMRPEEAAL